VGEGNASTPAPVVSHHRSLAFEQLLGHLRSLRRAPRLLDLGAAVGENVAFLASLPARLTIADLPSLLGATDSAQRGSTAFCATIEKALPPVEAGSIDAVLAWDLVNYLLPPEIERLGRSLAAACQPRALVFALISTLHEIPDQSQPVHILSAESLSYETNSRLRRKGPEYKEPDLCRWLSGFEVDTSFLLRNGMKEYLFVPRPALPTAAPPTGSRPYH
jgi:hypothetical protein